MAITDELREWGSRNLFLRAKFEELTVIADRIDAAHEEAIQCEHESTYDMGYAEGVGAELATIALGSARWLDKNKDEMVKHGFMHLPKDADGEYIHIGDEVYGYGWPDGGVYCKAIINECMILVGKADQKYSEWIMWDAEDTLHYHAPTVEDVLHSFICDVEEDVRDEREIIAEYATKLRLAGDAE